MDLKKTIEMIEELGIKERVLSIQLDAEMRKIGKKIRAWNMKRIEDLEQMVTDLEIGCEDLRQLGTEVTCCEYAPFIPSCYDKFVFDKIKFHAIDKRGFVLLMDGRIIHKDELANML